ncbi:transmembrane protease serine 9-like [Diprion similis]|uniref:transmembrane protease serine 9-like n=1 Tax=Diprion similis TaxID=362088 RepID=UPI001EF79C7E|nr:transmembrane protease serine 9-like [Diprion similis]
MSTAVFCIVNCLCHSVVLHNLVELLRLTVTAIKYMYVTVRCHNELFFVFCGKLIGISYVILEICEKNFRHLLLILRHDFWSSHRASKLCSMVVDKSKICISHLFHSSACFKHRLQSSHDFPGRNNLQISYAFSYQRSANNQYYCHREFLTVNLPAQTHNLQLIIYGKVRIQPMDIDFLLTKTNIKAANYVVKNKGLQTVYVYTLFSIVDNHLAADQIVIGLRKTRMKFYAVVSFALFAVHLVAPEHLSHSRAQNNKVLINSRITDGQNAVQGAYPYQASIWWGFPPEINSTHICGGAIINREWVITAGHCLSDLPEYGSLTVYGGKYTINVNESTQQSSTVKEQIIHPLYQGGENPHDIALLRLTTPFNFTSAISAITLPAQNATHTGNAVLTGWGSVSFNETIVLPTVLQTATVPIITNSACYSALYSLIGVTPLDDTNICTGSPSNLSVTFCAGDSGGPLAQLINGVWQLVGVVSWGVFPCGVSGMPSVYARVSNYTNWITAQTAYSVNLINPLSANEISVIGRRHLYTCPYEKIYKTTVKPGKIVQSTMKFAAIACLAVLATVAAVGEANPTWAQVNGHGAVQGAYPELHHLFGNSRIVNGQDAVQGAYPYQVSLWWGWSIIIAASHSCGGSLISEEWVVTAGHCFTELPSFGSTTVYAGKHLINVVEGTQQSSAVGQTFIHPSYVGGVAPHDIALIKLARPFTLNANVATIGLPAAGTLHAGDAVLSGWGSVSQTIFPSMPTVLQTATIPIVDTQVCYDALARIVANPPLVPTAIDNVCTGPLDNSRISACSGDSGGPLAQYISGSWELVGVVSWGISPCGTVGAPSVFVRVSAYIDWINGIVN